MKQWWLLTWHTVRTKFPLLLFVFALFLMGVGFGFVLVMALSLDQHQYLSRYVGGFLQLAVQGQLSDVQVSFWQAYAVHLKWLIFIWLLGISVIGLPVVLLLDFVKGVVLGFTVGFLTSQFSWKGFLYAMAAIFPSNILVVPVVLLASAMSISLSTHLVRVYLRTSEVSSPRMFLHVSLFYGALLLIASLAALIEVFVTPPLLRQLAPFLV